MHLAFCSVPLCGVVSVKYVKVKCVCYLFTLFSVRTNVKGLAVAD